MRRPISAIRKFQRVELQLRTAVQSLRAAIAEIDDRLTMKRLTKEDAAILRSTRAQVAKVEEDARNALGRLFDEVGG